jgi:phosphopantetheinyl transferase (holo-ACP synthase)
MLRLDFDMEGDLGIDSIKRVEIFGELQAEGVVPDGIDLDRLSRCRTLRQVLELLAPAPATKAPMHATDDAPGPWLGTVESIEPGRSLLAVRWLGRDDPVAGQHTLGGRRVSALDPTRLGLPVLPFTVMAEMLAQAAARLVPGRAAVVLRDIQAHRWIRYEDEPVALEIRAERAPERPDEVRVAIYNRGPCATRRRGDGDGPVVEGRVVFGDRRADGPVAPPWELQSPRPCRFDAGMIYRDQWLFHGPAFQAVVGIGRIAPRGIEGTLRVLPRRGLFRDGERPGLVTDPIVLDAFTHLFGCWGLDEIGDDKGDVIFPMRLAELSIFDADPGEGADVACRISVVDIQRHRVRVDADFIAPDGRVWMRLSGYDGWRFHWPARYRDLCRMPDRAFVGEPLPLEQAPTEPQPQPQAVWLQPPADFGKPVWRDVLEWLNLGPEERADCRAMPGPESRATLRLWGRVAAKEAVRRIWAAQGKPFYPADLRIVPDARGRPRVRSLLDPGRADLPAVSIAHTEGVAVALASPDPDARLGIDVEPIVDRSPEFESLAFGAAERAWLDRLAGTGTETGSKARRDEWIGRFWCAKEAVAKATGLGLVGGPGSVSIVAADASTGTVAVALGPELAAACPELGERPMRAITARRGEYVWAWTLAERMN